MKNYKQPFFSVLLMMILLFPLLINAAAYKVQIGDLIKVSLPEKNVFDKPFVVARDGAITLPKSGALMVVGLSKADLDRHIRTQLTKEFRNLSNLHVYVFKRQLLMSVRGYAKNSSAPVLAIKSAVQMALLRAFVAIRFVPENGIVDMALYAACSLGVGAQLNRLQISQKNKKSVFDDKKHLKTVAIKDALFKDKRNEVNTKKHRISIQLIENPKRANLILVRQVKE